MKTSTKPSKNAVYKIRKFDYVGQMGPRGKKNNRSKTLPKGTFAGVDDALGEKRKRAVLFNHDDE